MALSKTFAVGELLTAEDVNDHIVNHVPAPGDVYDTGWVDVTFQSGYQSFSGFPVRVRRVGLVVHLEGLVRGAGSSPPYLPAGSTHMFTIPDGYGFRPDVTMVMDVSGSSTTTPQGRLTLAPSGAASFATRGTPATSVYWSCHATWLAAV